MNCTNCLHNTLCEYAAKDHKILAFIRASIENGAADVMGSMEECCRYFQDKSKFIELQHAYWSSSTFGYTCSYCKSCATYEREYCPYCGARMDGEPEQNKITKEEPES